MYNHSILHVHTRGIYRAATCSILQRDINLWFSETLGAEGDRQAREN